MSDWRARRSLTYAWHHPESVGIHKDEEGYISMVSLMKWLKTRTSDQYPGTIRAVFNWIVFGSDGRWEMALRKSEQPKITAEDLVMRIRPVKLQNWKLQVQREWDSIVAHFDPGYVTEYQSW